MLAQCSKIVPTLKLNEGKLINLNFGVIIVLDNWSIVSVIFIQQKRYVHDHSIKTFCNAHSIKTFFNAQSIFFYIMITQ